jgi:hypothetical protein
MGQVRRSSSRSPQLQIPPVARPRKSNLSRKPANESAGFLAVRCVPATASRNHLDLEQTTILSGVLLAVEGTLSESEAGQRHLTHSKPRQRTFDQRVNPPKRLASVLVDLDGSRGFWPDVSQSSRSSPRVPRHAFVLAVGHHHFVLAKLQAKAFVSTPTTAVGRITPHGCWARRASRG